MNAKRFIDKFIRHVREAIGDEPEYPEVVYRTVYERDNELYFRDLRATSALRDALQHLSNSTAKAKS